MKYILKYILSTRERDSTRLAHPFIEVVGREEFTSKEYADITYNLYKRWKDYKLINIEDIEDRNEFLEKFNAQSFVEVYEVITEDKEAELDIKINRHFANEAQIFKKL